MIKFTTTLTFVLLCLCLSAQSPRNLTSNITWSSPTATLSSIQTAFNAARRAEETQLSLTTNVLGTLTLPSNFLSLSADAQAFILLNAERACRSGVNYGDGACKGWIFEGTETLIHNTAQTYANLMISSNCWSHTCGGNSPSTRITTAVGASCQEFVNRSENIAVFATSGSNIAISTPRSVYYWIYEDSPNWGHREACFLQDRSLDGNVTNGFADNHGATGAEGYMGIGVAGGGSYSAPFGTAYNYAEVVVLNFFDPTASGCSFTVLDVNLLSFKAIRKNGTSYLTWQTASEKNNAGFTIERSTDGYTFESIGFVKGANNATSLKNYDFTDATPLPNATNYYRLAWENESGKTQNSKIIALQAADKNQMMVYPNPMRDVVTVKLPNVNANTVLELTNAQGQILANVENNAQLNVSHLSAGVYFLRAQFDGKVVMQKLIKL